MHKKTRLMPGFFMVNFFNYLMSHLAALTTS
jgi:hypothetical protein